MVLAVYLHLLVDASRNVTRGHVNVTIEDLASALDVTEDEIEAILDAMQGRVLDGSALTGWELRQPKKEDLGNGETGAKSATERKREQRERERNRLNNDVSDHVVTECHDESQNVTIDKDKDKDKELIKEKNKKEKSLSLTVSDLVERGLSEQTAKELLHLRKTKKATMTPIVWDSFVSEAKILGCSLESAAKSWVGLNSQGFKAQWVINNQNKGGASPQINKQVALEERNQAVADEWLRSQGIVQ